MCHWFQVELWANKNAISGGWKNDDPCAKYLVKLLYAIIWKTENKSVAADEVMSALLCPAFVVVVMCQINQLLFNVSKVYLMAF